MISSWIQRDFGIDVIVEITKPISSSRDQIVTGKRFVVQLKSSDTAGFDREIFSLVVPKEKITYWYGSLEPILLVFIDLTKKTCFYRWIDEQMIRELFEYNPNWIAQDSVSVRFNRNYFIDPKQLLEIEGYVIHWKRPAKTILTPGNYFKYSGEAKGYVEMLWEKVRQYNIQFLNNELQELKKEFSRTIYTIAVAGPSRAGKSTLINCLLQKEVSPVGMLPTTGIPMTIFPKDENKALVIFKDGKELTGIPDSTFLRAYTSQDENPNNVKNVNLVSIHIINTLLEKGFALCDVPGLDDPDQEIRTITKTTLYNVNAIIYVINVASMRDGGFSITKQIVDDLAELGGRMDKLFLVFNKTDVLDADQRTQLEEYINSTLERFQISKYLPAPPVYISSKNSFNNRINNCNTADSVGDLEKQVWEFLLSNNKTGLHKILGSYADLKELIEKLRGIINARLLNAEKRTEVEDEIKHVKNEINELRKFVGEKRMAIYSNLEEYLHNSFMNILNYLQKDLSCVPLTNEFPNKKQISLWLENNAHRVISDIQANLSQNIYILQSEINQWISQKLNQVAASLEGEHPSIKFAMPDITKYTSQINHHMQEPQPGVIGILESILWVIGSFVVEIFISVGDALTPDVKVRAKHIRDTMNKSRKSYNKIAADFLGNLNGHLDGICRFMEEKSIDRTKVYLGELSLQLTKLDSQISTGEKENFEAFLRETAVIENEIASNFIHLKDYTDGIEWPHS